MFCSPLKSYAGMLLGLLSIAPLTACSLIVDPDESLLGGGDGVRVLDSGLPDRDVPDGAVPPQPDTGPPDAIMPPVPDATVVEPGPYRPANATREIWMDDASDVRLPEGSFLFDSSECSASMSESAIREQRAGGEFCVIWAQDFIIEEDAVLEIRGELPVAIIATGQVRIDGTIDVSARGVSPGAGGSSGSTSAEDEDGRGQGRGLGGSHEGTYDDGGGGGGAFCGDGGDGGQGGSAEGGRGGRRVEVEGLEPLVGGSGGGRGRGSFASGGTNAGFGGAGGGAIQISALESLTINGRIVAAGGGALPGSRRVRMRNWGSGGGGGSGGAVLLQAPTIRLSEGASINIAGGGGGGSAGSRRDGEEGQNGAETLRTVSGGDAGGADYGANGGDGAGGDRVNGEDGESNETGGANGGGGGGGAGCLVLRTNEPSLASEFRVSPGLESVVQRLPLE